jgi:putative addiction module component (TIGR02574 family)
MNIQELSISERILLAEQLWDSVISEQVSIEISEAQKEELDKRLTSYEKDQNSGQSWDIVKQNLIK